MLHDITTIGDIVKDTFIFPSLEEMYKPIPGAQVSSKDKDDRFLVMKLGDKISITDTFNSFGGTACNVAIGLARLKTKTSIISAIGKDDSGGDVITKLKKEKVDTTNVKTYSTRKTSFSIIISYKGERTILVNQSFSPEDLVLPKKLESEWLYIGALGQDYSKLYAKIIGLASQQNIKIALNPGTVQIHDGLRAFGALLGIAKIIFLNRDEAQRLTGLNGVVSVKDLAMSIRKTGVEVVVITDGDGGAYLSTEDEFLHLGAIPTTCVESTGAGDSFAAGFLSAYLKKMEPMTCLKYGVINGASVITKYGAQEGLLTVSVVEKKIKEYHFPANKMSFS